MLQKLKRHPEQGALDCNRAKCIDAQERAALAHKKAVAYLAIGEVEIARDMQALGARLTSDAIERLLWDIYSNDIRWSV
jgi:hypothetical protein